MYGPVCEQVTYGNCENVTWGTAVLYPAGCVSDILNKVGLCGKSIKRIMSHFLQAGGGAQKRASFASLIFSNFVRSVD